MGISVSVTTGDPLAPLDLSAAERAQGGALDIETVRALNPGDIEGLYRMLDRSAPRAGWSSAHGRRRHPRRRVALPATASRGA